MKAEKIWMDGKIIEWNKANIHVCTQAMHYGSGVFEGIICGASAIYLAMAEIINPVLGRDALPIWPVKK